MPLAESYSFIYAKIGGGHFDFSEKVEFWVATNSVGRIAADGPLGSRRGVDVAGPNGPKVKQISISVSERLGGRIRTWTNSQLGRGAYVFLQLVLP